VVCVACARSHSGSHRFVRRVNRTLPMARGSFAFSLVVAVGLGPVGCSAKRDAAALVAAMERFQRADNATKASQVPGVAAVSCADPQVCETKRACLAAIEPTAQALTLKDEVSARIEDLQAKRLSPDSPEAQALPGKLDSATKLLSDGRAKMPDCERKLAELRIASGH
jgi:hypothetical protein